MKSENLPRNPCKISLKNLKDDAVQSLRLATFLKADSILGSSLNSQPKSMSYQEYPRPAARLEVFYRKDQEPRHYRNI